MILVCLLQFDIADNFRYLKIEIKGEFKVKKVVITMLFIFGLSAIGANATTLTLPGPTLIYHNIGWPNTGIQITALENVTLLSFDFANYGASDTIELTDNNRNVLYSTQFGGGGGGNQLITTNWSLIQGNTYDLISVDPSNSMWVDYTNWPTSNAQIQVNGGYSFDHDLQSSYWFHFTELTTTDSGASPVPEPATMLLLGLGLVGLAGVRRKFKK